MGSASILSYLARVAGISILGSIVACLLLAGYERLNPPKESFSAETLLRWYAMLACVAFWIFAILAGILLYPPCDSAADRRGEPQSMEHAD